MLSIANFGGPVRGSVNFGSVNNRSRGIQPSMAFVAVPAENGWRGFPFQNVWYCVFNCLLPSRTIFHQGPFRDSAPVGSACHWA